MPLPTYCSENIKCPAVGCTDDTLKYFKQLPVHAACMPEWRVRKSPREMPYADNECAICLTPIEVGQPWTGLHVTCADRIRIPRMLAALGIES
jgi:hypothetical protein